MDVPKPLTDDELTEIADSLDLEREAKAGNVGAQLSLRLVAEVRRLREILDAVEPYVSIALAPPGVMERLRAEIRRGGR